MPDTKLIRDVMFYTTFIIFFHTLKYCHIALHFKVFF